LCTLKNEATSSGETFVNAYQLTRHHKQECWNLPVGAHKKGGSRVPAPEKPRKRNLKDIDFVDIMISKVLHDFPFSRNQPLKSADDKYIRILKNKLMKLKKKEDRTL
jgi:hypothetical protein